MFRYLKFIPLVIPYLFDKELKKLTQQIRPLRKKKRSFKRRLKNSQPGVEYSILEKQLLAVDVLLSDLRAKRTNYILEQLLMSKIL